MNPFISTQAANQNDSSGSAKEQLTAENVLAKILEQEHLCLEQVIQLLKTENTAIIERDIESMGHLLDKKLPLLSKIEQLDQQRQQYFEQQSGLSYQHSAFTHFIEQYSSQATHAMWHTIKEKLSECKTQNELNGRIISIKKDNTEQILQILLGHPAHSTPTYSHLGQTKMQKQSALYTAV